MSVVQALLPVLALHSALEANQYYRDTILKNEKDYVILVMMKLD